MTPTLRSSRVPDSLLCTMEMQSTVTGPQPGESSMQPLLQLTLEHHIVYEFSDFVMHHNHVRELVRHVDSWLHPQASELSFCRWGILRLRERKGLA